MTRELRLVLAGVAMVLAIWSGCANARKLSSSSAELPTQNTVVREQLVIYSDFPLPTQHRLLDELAALRGDVTVKLQLPTSNEPIHVYLFESAGRFESFLQMHFPEMPPRRAFFLESDTRLAVYAHWGDRVAEDLRHEVTHGYLHSVLPNLPLWLDEGLAEYFEVPRGTHGYHRPHLDELARRAADGSWRPNLERLELLKAMQQMQQIDYAESWAWVHYLLETTPARREVLFAYLKRLRAEGAGIPLSMEMRKLSLRMEEELLAHLRGLNRTTPPEVSIGP